MALQQLLDTIDSNPDWQPASRSRTFSPLPSALTGTRPAHDGLRGHAGCRQRLPQAFRYIPAPFGNAVWAFVLVFGRYDVPT